MKTFKRVLIANRGEIAHRIAMTAQKLGLEPIIVYSDADQNTLTVQMAPEAYYLGRSPVAESYLNQEKIIDLALKVKAEAIHPGYGLLSEISEFARKVRKAGLLWIGPDPESMEKVASKSKAKEVAKSARVPVLEGYQGVQDPEKFKAAARALGYPVLLKATAGGGGRGIRKVYSDEELLTQLELAKTEAKNAFGDDEILLEKFVEKAWHIEVQVFGDAHGNVIHLGERDCSTQRRNQKIIEEAPSSSLTPELRKEICEAGVRVAKEAGYTNAGTVEFLVTPEKNYYFLEMNTRLQVEHCVTEEVTGLDLVELQFRVARGESLPEQKSIRTEGHAIEARFYAEDPYLDFLPQTGKIRAFRFPKDVRVDHFLKTGTFITPFYDSMLAKVIVRGKDREDARKKLLTALCETFVMGLTTNGDFLQEILQTDEFRGGIIYTRWLDEKKFSRVPLSEEEKLKIADLGARTLSSEIAPGPMTFWSNLGEREAFYLLSFEGRTYPVHLRDHGAPGLPYLRSQGEIQLSVNGRTHVLTDLLTHRSSAQVIRNPLEIVSRMDGALMKLLVKRADAVVPGQVVAVVEAMKMQIELKAEISGVVDEVFVTEKTVVKSGERILRLKA